MAPPVSSTSSAATSRPTLAGDAFGKLRPQGRKVLDGSVLQRLRAPSAKRGRQAGGEAD